LDWQAQVSFGSGFTSQLRTHAPVFPHYTHFDRSTIALIALIGQHHPCFTPSIPTLHHPSLLYTIHPHSTPSIPALHHPSLLYTIHPCFTPSILALHHPSLLYTKSRLSCRSTCPSILACASGNEPCRLTLSTAKLNIAYSVALVCYIRVDSRAAALLAAAAWGM
jgi:hypothetical protein